MIKLKILVENRKNIFLKDEFGLSVLVNAFGNKFLFDTGYSRNFRKNARVLMVNLKKIKKVVLSHGHSDHSNGIQFLPYKRIIFVNPNVYKPRWSISTGKFSGFPMERAEFIKKHNVIETSNFLQIQPNCFYLGEIPMVVDFEKDGNFATTLDEELTQVDYTEDDSGVAITTEQGLFVMTGCGHRGICNVIEHAKKVTGQSKIYAVFGGFHLRDLEKQREKIDSTISYLKSNGIKELFLGHCITDEVISYFKKNLNGVKIMKLRTGRTFRLPLNPLQKVYGKKFTLDEQELSKLIDIVCEDKELCDVVHKIVNKIISYPDKEIFSIASLIDYNAKISLINPINQGKILRCVKKVCGVLNINIVAVQDGFTGLAYHYKYKKM